MFLTQSLTILSLISLFGTGHSHGYVLSPRSRNFVAWQDGVWSGATESDYPKEDCPHCANLGGTLAQCGLIGDTNYDDNLNFFGNPMPADPQAEFSQGDEIDVDVVLTAHHMGHFEFFACPIEQGEHPTADCFTNNPLEFVADPLYGAPKDVNYPNRAYIAPRDYEGIISDNTGIAGLFYRFRLKLPDNLSGDLVLLQWHYLTANSCVFPGYSTYPFPAEWGSMHNNVGLCGPLPPDGNGVPEQFWNCAEISIAEGPSASTTPAPIPAPSTSTLPPSPAYTSPPVLSPTRTPAPVDVPVGGGTCGNGKIGDGVCSESNLCCSAHGWCGVTPDHCKDHPTTSSPVPLPNPTSAPVATPAPVIDSTSAPVVPTSDLPWEEWVLSTDSRCGINEADARGNCRSICSSNADCPSDQHCWSVHANYCGSKPQPEECNSSPKGGFACGVSELVARETCGESCTLDSQCGMGEHCYALHLNFCDCDSGNGRKLRGNARK